MRYPLKLIVYSCLFASGFSGLVFETIWLRVFSLVFGNTVSSAAVVLAGFFLGLSAGSYWFGNRVDRAANPLRWFAFLELGIFLSVLPLLKFHPAFESIYPGLYSALNEAPFLFTTVKILLAFLVVTGPAFFMGGTLPVLASFMIPNPAESTARGGVLYGINTLGAALGAVAGGMVLPALAGVNTTFILAAFVNLGNFVLIYLLSMKAGFSTQQADPVAHEPVPPKRAGLPSKFFATPFHRYLAAAAFFSGFSLLSLEVLWTRMFSLVFHNSVYTFSAVVVAFLIALGLGSFLASVLDRKIADTRALLALVFLLTGASCFTTPFLFVHWTGLRFFAAGSGWTEYLFRVFGLVFGILLVPAALGGMVLPLIWKLYDRARAGPRLGIMNAVNALGTISGSLAAGFIMIPRLGTWNSITLVSLFYLIFADMSLKHLSGNRYPGLMKRSIYVLLPCVFLFNPAKLPLQFLNPHEHLAYLKEGTAATVAVIEKPNSWVMKVNNHYTLGGVDPLLIERMQAQIPLFLHPRPETVAFIGLATGITAGAAVAFQPREIHIAEIVPQVVEAAKWFEPFNEKILSQKNVFIHREDGRNFILGTALNFDVIVSDLFVPNHAGTGTLYSREHFAHVRSKLKPGGIFCQWLPAYELSPRDFKIIAATFRSLFPANSVWMGDFSSIRPLVALIGFKSPRKDSFAALAGRLEHFRHNHADETTLMFEPGNFFLLYMGSLNADPELEHLPLNTDQNPLIEYSAPIKRTNKKLFTETGLESYWELLIKNTGAENFLYKDPSFDLTGMGQAGLELTRAIGRKKRNDPEGMVRHLLKARSLAPGSSHLQNMYDEIKRQLAQAQNG